MKKHLEKDSNTALDPITNRRDILSKVLENYTYKYPEFFTKEIDKGVFKGLNNELVLNILIVDLFRSIIREESDVAANNIINKDTQEKYIKILDSKVKKAIELNSKGINVSFLIVPVTYLNELHYPLDKDILKGDIDSRKYEHNKKFCNYLGAINFIDLIDEAHYIINRYGLSKGKKVILVFKKLLKGSRLYDEIDLDLMTTNKRRNDILKRLEKVKEAIPIKRQEKIIELVDGYYNKITYLIELIKNDQLFIAGSSKVMASDRFELEVAFLNEEVTYNRGKNVHPFKQLIDILNANQFIEVLNHLSKRVEIDGDDIADTLHNFNINFPNIPNYKYEGKTEFANEFFNFLIKVLNEQDKDTYLNLLQFINYARVRNGLGNERKTELFTYISKVRAARRGIKISHNMECSIPNTVQYDLFGNGIEFTKNPDAITSIGKLTLCCFTLGGIASKLVEVALNSRTSNILKGIEGRMKWFSFTWEIVEYNKDTGLYETSLVLDNIESNQKLTLEYFNERVVPLLNTGYYKNIYLGYMRNDIYFKPTEIEGLEVEDKLRDKPYSTVMYEDSFGNFDDSAKLHVMHSTNWKENPELKEIEVDDIALKERLLFILRIDENNLELSNEVFSKLNEYKFKALANSNLTAIKGIEITSPDGEVVFNNI